LKVMVILGSSSDMPVAEKCTALLSQLGIEHGLHIASAHRTPDEVKKLAEGPSDVFIAIAGLAAALPGVVAAHTIKPVIGVPVAAKLEGLDALLSIMQMPPGIPVATVGIDRGDNAAILAAEIIAVTDKAVAKKLVEYRAQMREKVIKEDRELRK